MTNPSIQQYAEVYHYLCSDWFVLCEKKYHATETSTEKYCTKTNHSTTFKFASDHNLWKLHVITCSNLTTETLEQGMKYVQS